MIDFDLPKPEMGECAYCHRRTTDGSRLLHWPSAKHAGVLTVKMTTGAEIEPFSMWVFVCRWCSGLQARRRRKECEAMKRDALEGRR